MGGTCEVTVYDPVFVLFVFSTIAIVFNTSADIITYHSRLAKDIDPYFKYQLCGGTRPPFYRMECVNLDRESESRNTEINLCRGWDFNPLPLIDGPASYR